MSCGMQLRERTLYDRTEDSAPQFFGMIAQFFRRFCVQK